MLGLYPRRLLTKYNESEYRVDRDHYEECIDANAVMAEPQRIDLKILDASKARMNTVLKASGISLSLESDILDVCCGTGFICRNLAKLGRVNRVYALDLSDAQVHLLKDACNRDASCREKIAVMQGNVLFLPFADERFDVVMGNSFLHHIPDVQAALKEIRRVLKPGGTLVMTHEPTVWANFWESFPVSLYKPICPPNLTDLWMFTKGDICRLLENNGFKVLKIANTGVLAHLLVGPLMIPLDRFFLDKCNHLRKSLQKVKAVLAGLEYHFGLPFGQSLLVVCSKNLC